MEVTIKDDCRNSELIVGHLVIEGIENAKNRNNRIEKLVSVLEKEIKENSANFLNNERINAYERFINSSKSAIASTACGPKILVELILKSGHLPKISRAVDCMNIVSIRSGLTFSMWNKDLIKGNIVYKMSNGKEKYWPFMGEEVELLKDEVAAFDDEKVLCLVRYRDSKYAPTTIETKNLVVHVQGVAGIKREAIENALDEIERLLVENVKGKVVEKKIIMI
ncbi:hypothetical protein J4206_03800 [Candidatus Woesearchaeota archaeon]|nr:hypothetical protein [Candidatus Woesearchaeota archaeon]